MVRMIMASIIGGIMSLCMFTSINQMVIQILGICLMVFVAFGYVDFRYTIQNIIYTYILSVLLGGVIYLFNIRVTTNVFVTYLIIIVISIEVMVLYVKEMKKMKSVYNNYYGVDIYFRSGEKVHLVGFVDTGNNLYDPYKKRPIILVSHKYEKYCSDDKVILVPYYTAEGEGLLKCMRPDIIFIDGIGYKGGVLVGFSNSVKLIDGVDVILHKDVMKG